MVVNIMIPNTKGTGKSGCQRFRVLISIECSNIKSVHTAQCTVTSSDFAKEAVTPRARSRAHLRKRRAGRLAAQGGSQSLTA